jgi:hypothetical protein
MIKMELIEINTPERIQLEISNDRSKKVYSIGWLRNDTCQVVQGLLDTIDPSVFDGPTIKKTNYSLVEENRDLLCMIIAIAIYNYKHEFSKKVFRFIKSNTTAHELIALAFIVKKQIALWIIHYFQEGINKQRIAALIQSHADEQMKNLNRSLEKSNRDNEMEMQALAKQWQGIKEKLTTSIEANSKLPGNLKITQYAD